MRFEDLYAKTYKSKHPAKPDRFIALYEEHQTLIEGTDCEGDYDCFFKKMRFASDYAHALFKKESYHKALQASTYALGLYESHPKASSQDLLQQDYYKLLLFDQGVSYYHVGRKSAAANNFKRLYERFPENEDYRAWLVESQDHQYRNIENIFLIMLGIGLLGDIFVGASVPAPWHYGLLGMLVVGFIGVASIRIILYLKKKQLADLKK